MLGSFFMKIALLLVSVFLFVNPASIHVEPESSSEIVNTLSLTKNTNCLLSSSSILESSEELRKKRISTQTLFQPFNFFNAFIITDLSSFVSLSLHIKNNIFKQIYFFNPVLFFSKLHLNSPPTHQA